MFFALPRLKVDLRGIRHDISPMTSQIPLPEQAEAAFSIGDVVRHRIFDFRGVVFDIDPVFANSDDDDDNMACDSDDVSVELLHLA